MDHYSDCAQHNNPAFEVGECDCGAEFCEKWLFLRLLFKFRMWCTDWMNGMRHKHLRHMSGCPAEHNRWVRAVEALSKKSPPNGFS